MKQETKIHSTSSVQVCQNCKQSFTIEPEDFGFYEKIKVPPPTFCPECRRQRRWAQKNNMTLYNRKCDLCGKSSISLFNPDSGFIVYCNKCWWSDKWDPKSYGVDYDFSKPFFTQFKKLAKKVPQMAMINDDDIASINCEYTSDWWFSKNCYMCFVGWHMENSMYNYFGLAGREIMDCMNIRSENEWLYECIMMRNNFKLKYSELCLNCMDSQFLYDCQNCIECFMCAGLRNKKYHFKNKKYSKEDYETILQNYRLDTFSGAEKTKKEFEDFILKQPRRYALIWRTVNCTGDTISDSKNCKNSFVIKNAENVRYSDFVGDSSAATKDCYDITTTGGTQESYECVVGDHSQLNLFGFFTVKSQDVRYTEHCHNGKHLFGCVGLKNANYCILNKQYSKEEYEELVPKIIEHMNDIPYVDTKGNVYKYGEYYPIELSSFGYNETSALESFALSKDEALRNGYSWQDNIQRTTSKETLLPENIPDSIKDINDSILAEVLRCNNCGRNYKIVPNELTFYREMKIPIPRKCFFCRHEARLAKRNPFKLWHRKCMKEGCVNEFDTSYAPNRSEIVYCERCYQQEVY